MKDYYLYYKSIGAHVTIKSITVITPNGKYKLRMTPTNIDAFTKKHKDDFHTQSSGDGVLYNTQGKVITKTFIENVSSN